MEPHAVPQDILYAEFKLFGSFTLKQFLKLIMGCLVALIFFSVPLPFLIKIPLVIAILLITLGIAAVPRFEQKFGNFFKAIFISPRYIWIKQNSVPDILAINTMKAADKTAKASATTAKKKVDLMKVSLEDMLDAKKDYEETGNLPKIAQEKNFDRVYKDAFTKQNIATQPAMQQAVQTIKSNKIKTRDDYIREIQELKKQLAMVSKSPNSKEQETEIMNQINELLIELKSQGLIPQQQAKDAQNQSVVTNAQGTVEAFGQLVSGLVVDKSNNALSGAQIVFDDVGGSRDILAVTDQNGKFVSRDKLITGEYDITVQYPNKRFHSYKIAVGKDKLPMYKLREK
jgi:hypothetical protein